MACIHCPLKWNKSKLALAKKSQSNCSVCEISDSKLWACLENNCDFVGCPESVEDHSSIHYEETKHAIAVNLVSFRCWCYVCQREVYLAHLFTAEEMKEFKGKLRKKSETENKSRSADLLKEAERNLKLESASLSSVQLLMHEDDDLDITESVRGLTGLRNLGNTCYMNGALQSLSNCPQLTLYFLALGKFYKFDKKTIMAQSYYRLMCDMWSKSRYASVSPTAVNASVKMINPSFRGHQQQDTQELLRCLMDRLHEETKNSFISIDNIMSKCDGGDADSIVSPSPSSGSEQVVNSSSDDSFMSCDSKIKPSNRNDLQTMSIDDHFPKELDQLHSSGSPLFRCNSFPTLVANKTNHQAGLIAEESSRKRTMSSHFTNSLETNDVHRKVKKHKELKYDCRSVISDIFDGALWSSVQCKTCYSIWHTKETFQDLSLPIPGKDDAARLHGLAAPQLSFPLNNLSSGPCANTETYSNRLYDFWDWLKSWFFGPQVTLSDCLSAFFSNDELKGDNMYSCEKCNKLRNGIKYCRLLSLPEVLCVHLKRFRYEYLTSYSTKLSTAVTFPLHNLDLSRYVASDCSSNVKTYDLSSVIVHQGGAGGGHYTAYCKNPLNGKWYEFDDQYVTEVSESVVQGAEAYVLFYSKSCSDAFLFREEVLNLENVGKQSVFMRFYISLEWAVKFLTHAEPGPINNHYFLCRHGNVKPSLANSIEDRTCCISEKMWHILYQKFGGGPVVTRLQVCEFCISEEKRLDRRRNEEQEMYLKLSEVREDEYKLQTYLISMTWFRNWQAFIQGESDPPEPINNNSVVTTVDGRVTVKKDGDYGELTADAWKYLHSRYGGGPPIPRVGFSFSVEMFENSKGSNDD